MAHVSLVSIQPTYKRGVARISLIATPLLLAIILVRTNAYSQALATLHLSGYRTVYAQSRIRREYFNVLRFDIEEET